MSNIKQFDLSIIIPIFNEEENIPRLISILNTNLSSLNHLRIEILFVDDGSSDDSFTLLKKARHRVYSPKIIKLSKNFGSHAALRAGILHARGKFITFVSADLQDPLEVIPKLYSKCQEGFDLVLACRNDKHTYFAKKLISRFYSKLVQRFIFPHFPESNFDIVMFNEKVKNALNQHIETHSSLFLQIFDLGFKQAIIHYSKQSRMYGNSKWTFSKKIKLLIDSFAAFSYAPIRFISVIGITLSILGGLWAIYVVLRAIIFKDIQSGWPTLISILMIGFGITNISLGIIAEYLWRTFDVSRHKPTFIIDEIIDLHKK